MMNMTIGNTSIEITSCERMRDLQKGFFLEIKVPKENISSDDLEALLDGCTETIIVIEENGTETEYKGFNDCASIMTKDGFRYAAQYCSSEAMAQLSLAQSKINIQDSRIRAQEEADMMQTMTIESLMLEVLPELMAATVEEAVARALAANSTTPEVAE